MKNWTRIKGTQFMRPPAGKISCPICYITDYTGYVDTESGKHYPSDMDAEIHKGFTIGKGKTLYWMMLWLSSGNATAFNKKATYGRWISGDTEITIHFK